ncbi:MAG: ATP-binding cassette domain-containing protein, partial [Solirubrobacteraceae bacterium]
MTERMTEPKRETRPESRDATRAAARGKAATGGPEVAVETRPGRADAGSRSEREAVFEIEDVTVSYGGVAAVREVSFDIRQNEICALIGPSGCGKSTLIRCLNRMNDLIPSATVDGSVLYHGEDLYSSSVDPVQVRKRIGMVFQKPNPFPKSIYDNIAFGPRVLGIKGDMDQIVESALQRGALWDEVKDRLKTNAFGMSGGQQQR